MHAQLLSFLLVAPFLLSQAVGETRTAERVSATIQDPAGDPKAEYEKRKAEAQGSVEKLWKLYDWCEVSGLKSESRSTLRAILKIDTDDKKAHELLGHVSFEGKWYDNQKKLDEFKKKQLEEQAKASGKVVYKGAIVDPADVPFLEKGMTKDAAGKWVDTETQKKIAEGWVRQDLNWIPPAEAENIAKGLWKCGDKWLSVEEADKYHSEVARWWTLANERFILYSTCPRKTTEAAMEQCEHAYRDLMRTYGKTPTVAVPVVLLKSREQYSSFARGEAGYDAVEASGLSSVHGAFMADALVQFLSTGQTLPGVAYWDASNDKEGGYGPMYLRHAAGQSFGEAIDQSPKSLVKLAKGDTAGYADGFWKEKQIPMWFRFGAAAYAERYVVNTTVAAKGNPNELREWSVTNITNKGGLDPIDRILAFEIGVGNDNSGKLINESGLLVAFALDGKCVDVQTKLGALKDAIKNNKDIPKAAQALADEIKKNEAKLRIWANL
ncbi:MAG TPA: hypothetical protein VK843_12180 [Planctomycetota bacterium]|nr:hypothetical protein [Planctomycetota bacterium]